MDPAIISAIELIIGAILIPGSVWVVSSIFSLKQAIALIALDINQNRKLFELLEKRLK